MPRRYTYTPMLGRRNRAACRHRSPGRGGRRTFVSWSPSPSRARAGASNYRNLFRLFEYGHVRNRDDGWSNFLRPKPEADAPAPPKPEEAEPEVLKVEKVDLNVAENVRKHHTDEYEITEGEDAKLVVRRGEPFTIKIDFNRAYDAKKDDLRLVFQIGDNPKPSKDTHVEFILSDKDLPNEWGAKLSRQSGKSAWITFFTPSACFVGRWDLKVDVVKRKDQDTAVFRYSHDSPIYMLFNPWNKEDMVYMEKEMDKMEYVMNDTGRIWVGSARRFTGRPWVFGQFGGNILDCVMDLLEESDLNIAVRGNPIPVVRKLSALVNSSDDNGVLTGNWSGDYSGGTSPLTWTGSAAILEEYYKNKQPVSFGQCWVFSGVLTTVMRSLGIPARSVTNFASAHDCDGSISIDKHFDSEGNDLDHMNDDSIWNFHVWNEAWMARPDLKEGYGGWQACDATPQELSDGIYCCGPVSVRAVREGQVNLPYDAPFVFAEVNADVVHWNVESDGSMKRTNIRKNTVGRYISTKSAGTTWRDDVTRAYKFPEDSAEERAAVRQANYLGSSRKEIYETGVQDVEFSLEADSENMWLGLDFVVHVRAKNTSSETRTISGRTNVSTMFYTGVTAEQITSEPYTSVEIKPGKTVDMTVSIPVSTYQRKLKDCCMFYVSAFSKVKQTNQIFTDTDDFRLRKPHLTIKAPSKAKKEEEFEVQLSFTNPLPTPLTDCYIMLEGPGLGGHAKRYELSDVAAKGTAMTTMKLKPKKVGKKEIIAIFNCRELEDVNGTHEIEVTA